MPIKLGVPAAAPCRSDKEKDLHGLSFCSGGDDEGSMLYLLDCGGRGGREQRGDDAFEFKDSELLLLSEQLEIAPRANELLEFIGLLYNPPLLFLGK